MHMYVTCTYTHAHTVKGSQLSGLGQSEALRVSVAASFLWSQGSGEEGRCKSEPYILFSLSPRPREAQGHTLSTAG